MSIITVHARGLGIDAVYEINRFAVGDCMPELTLFFDVLPATGLARIDAARGREVNRLDLEGIRFECRPRYSSPRFL